MAAKPPTSRVTRHVPATFMPTPPESAPALWGHEREGLSGMLAVEQALLIVESDAWQKVIKPACLALDGKRGARGPKRIYHAEELELALLYGSICRCRTLREVRELLAGDREPEARSALGFDWIRFQHHSPRHLQGVPCEETLRRHLKRIGYAEHAALWSEASKVARDTLLSDPALHEAMRQLSMDGMSVYTHYKAPRWRMDKDAGRKRLANRRRFERDEKTGAIIRHPRTGKPKQIGGWTSGDAGFRADGTDGHKGGDGWQAVILSNVQGLPLGYELGRLADPEWRLGAQVIEDYAANVLPKLTRHDGRDLTVVSADAAFRARAFKRRLHDVGIAPNIHNASHGKNKTYAKKLAKVRLLIEDHPNWFSTGRYELTCACGKCRLEKRAERSAGGKAVMRVIGRCETCGRITVTAGMWKRADRNANQVVPLAAADTNPTPQERAEAEGTWMVRMEPIDDPGIAEWAFGNYLTYDDKHSKAYGEDRYGYGESINSTLKKRFAFGQDKTWMRQRAQVEVHLAQAIVVMLTLAHKQVKSDPGSAKLNLPTGVVRRLAPPRGAPPGQLPKAA